MQLSPVLDLACQLVRRKSLTPNDAGCQALIREILEAEGFECRTLQESGSPTVNLLALHGSGSPFSLCLGHTDVVPAGEVSSWDFDPWGGQVQELQGRLCLCGRGSTDMKGGDAAMIMALCSLVRSCPSHAGTVGLLLTSNEEGDASGGVPFVTEYLRQQSLIPDYCLIAEASSEKVFGDEIKNGRRGDLMASVTVYGRQGHVAVPGSGDNAAHKAVRLISAILDHPLDQGSEYFPPTSFQVSNARCGTGAYNVVPGSFNFRCGWRFNDLQSYESIDRYLKNFIVKLGFKCDVDWIYGGLPYLTKGGVLLDIMQECVREVLGRTPAFGTTGGTSDGRFIAALGTQVMEFGPLTGVIHQVNEFVPVEDLQALEQIYTLALRRLAETPVQAAP